MKNEKSDFGLSDDIVMRKIKEFQRETIEARRFWIPVIISIIALAIAVASLVLQFKSA